MLPFPDLPDVPDRQSFEARASLRYEDVSQDGRVTVLSLPPILGGLWRTLAGQSEVITEGRKAGIVPILSRFVMAGDEVSVSVGRRVDARGSYQLAHTVDDDGEVNRLVLNMWAEMRGVRGRTYASQGDRVRAGRIFAEHVFTRPFAPAGERKVLAFDYDSMAPVPAHRQSWRAPADVLALPAGAATHSRDISPAMQVTFGLFQTDSNQHVNSLVYPRLFEQAAIGRLAELGKPTRVLSRYCEVAYRKPSFAGDTVHIALATYELGDRFGAVGVFLDKPALGDAAAIVEARPRCFVHMQLAR